MKSTNYYNTFIEVSEDCPATTAEIPIQKGDEKSIPILQLEMIKNNPYKYTMDDVVFGVFAIRNGLDQLNEEERGNFFSKGQPCLRTSPLLKRYGWGIHCNEKGLLAIYPINSDDYKKLKNDKNLQHIKAMRSKK